MSVQRWYATGRVFGDGCGPYVEYADHVVALLTQDRQHMEALAEAEQRGRGERESYWTEAHLDALADERANTLDAAREAVDNLQGHGEGRLLVFRDAVLAAIDALIERGAET
jgi:hypothetical protein